MTVRVVVEELVEPVARLKMLHQYPHRDPCAVEHRSSTEDVRVPVDQLVGHPDVTATRSTTKSILLPRILRTDFGPDTT